MWSDVDVGHDVAISFQEAGGADYVWRVPSPLPPSST